AKACRLCRDGAARAGEAPNGRTGSRTARDDAWEASFGKLPSSGVGSTSIIHRNTIVQQCLVRPSGKQRFRRDRQVPGTCLQGQGDTPGPERTALTSSTDGGRKGCAALVMTTR